MEKKIRVTLECTIIINDNAKGIKKLPVSMQDDLKELYNRLLQDSNALIELGKARFLGQYFVIDQFREMGRMLKMKEEVNVIKSHALQMAPDASKRLLTVLEAGMVDHLLALRKEKVLDLIQNNMHIPRITGAELVEIQ